MRRDAAIGLSQGTEAILFTHTATIDTFHYYVDSVEVTAEATASRAALPSPRWHGKHRSRPRIVFPSPTDVVYRLSGHSSSSEPEVSQDE